MLLIVFTSKWSQRAPSVYSKDDIAYHDFWVALHETETFPASMGQNLAESMGWAVNAQKQACLVV